MGKSETDEGMHSEQETHCNMRVNIWMNPRGMVRESAYENTLERYRLTHEEGLGKMKESAQGTHGRMQ